MYSLISIATIIWGFVGLVVGLLIFYLINKVGYYKAIGITALSTLCFVSIQVNIGTEKRVQELCNEFNQIKLNSEYLTAPKNSRNPVYNEVLEFFHEEIEMKSEGMKNGNIKLTSSEVKSIWEILIRNASKSIYATNTIAPDDWPFKSCKMQKNAKVKKIKRIMLRRRNEPEFNNRLDSLAHRQLRECGIDNIYHYLKESLYSNFNDEIEELGYIDIVMADESVMLLTNYDENTKHIIGGFLTIQPKKIKTAKSLFNSLFRLSEEYKLEE